MPVGVEKVHDAERDIVNGGEADLYLKSAIEGVIIKWATQINDVMQEDSSHAFNNGANPVPSSGVERESVHFEYKYNEYAHIFFLIYRTGLLEISS